MFEEDAEYPKELRKLHNDLPSLLERMKIKKCHKLVCNMYDKKVCYTHKNFKISTKSWINIEKGA